jgi:hypothetical protein
MGMIGISAQAFNEIIPVLIILEFPPAPFREGYWGRVLVY